MNTSKITIKAGSGSYTILDKKYSDSIKTYLAKINDDTYERWLTYDTILNELIWLDKTNYFEEFKYRFTGGEDPNDVLVDIINREPDIKTYLWSHLKRINDYINEDLIKRFT